MFCEQANKRTRLPPAKTTFTGVDVSFERACREMSEQRETTSAPMRYAILGLTVDSVSGRGEDSMLLDKKVAQSATFLSKSIQTYHAAAGDSPFIWSNVRFGSQPRHFCQMTRV